MPDKEDRSIASLKERAKGYMRDAEDSLLRTELGEMERQIEQSRLYELAYNLLIQVGIDDSNPQLLKLASEQASKWATNMRQATTKRRNDEVPKLIEAMKDRRQFARDLLGIEEVD